MKRYRVHIEHAELQPTHVRTTQAFFPSLQQCRVWVRGTEPDPANGIPGITGVLKEFPGATALIVELTETVIERIIL